MNQCNQTCFICIVLQSNQGCVYLSRIKRSDDLKVTHYLHIKKYVLTANAFQTDAKELQWKSTGFWICGYDAKTKLCNNLTDYRSQNDKKQTCMHWQQMKRNNSSTKKEKSNPSECHLHVLKSTVIQQTPCLVFYSLILIHNRRTNFDLLWQSLVNTPDVIYATVCTSDCQCDLHWFGVSIPAQTLKSSVQIAPTPTHNWLTVYRWPWSSAILSQRFLARGWRSQRARRVRWAHWSALAIGACHLKFGPDFDLLLTKWPSSGHSDMGKWTALNRQQIYSDWFVIYGVKPLCHDKETCLSA